MTSTARRLTPSILTALRDCDSFRDGLYVWKRATMTKAVALGLAYECPDIRGSSLTAFALTDAGRAALAAAKAGGSITVDSKAAIENGDSR